MMRPIHAARLMLIPLALHSCGASARAAEEDKPTVVRLSVDPAAEPRPALKYSLLPTLNERTAGNAVPFYYRAILAYAKFELRYSKSGRNAGERLSELAKAPLETFPKDEARNLMPGRQVFDDLRTAAFREDCNWDWRLQDMEGTKSVMFLLEEVQQARGVARFLAVKARLEIAEHRYDDAIDTLRVGYQFARDVGRPPMLITALVAIAIATIVDEQAHALMGSPGAPNLYWAFSELPRPLIDLGPAMEYELFLPFRVFPILKDPEDQLHSPEQWAQLVAGAFYTTANSFLDVGKDSTYWPSRLGLTALALRGYTQAKRELIAAGHDRAKIERLPVGQVIAMHEALLCRHVSDEYRKWVFIGGPTAQARLRQVDEELKRERYLGPPFSTRETVPIIATLFPAVVPAYQAMARPDVSTAADRVIEALRMHAAQNGGKLPRSLAEITVVPVPANPKTGEPFPYRIEGEKAFLDARRFTVPPAPRQEPDYLFEITIRRNPSKIGS